MNSTKSKIIATAIVAAFAALGVVFHFTNRSLLVSLCQEDGVVESLTAIFYFVAFGLFLSACRLHGYRNLWFAGFGCLFFLIAAEEISWGQRAFGIGTPASLAEINVQAETTLHNIEGIHGRVRALALLFVLGVCFVIPSLTMISRRIKHFAKKLHFPIFPLWATGIMTISVLLMAVPRLAFNSIIFEIDELGEITLAVGFLLFAWTVYVETESNPRLETVDGAEWAAAS